MTFRTEAGLKPSFHVAFPIEKLKLYTCYRCLDRKAQLRIEVTEIFLQLTLVEDVDVLNSSFKP